VLPFVEDDGRALLELCNERKLEGVVAKRKTAPYRPGPRRSHDWIKLKCAREDDFVVVGWITGKGSRKLGALCLASYAGGRLVIRGKVGGGLDSRTLDLLGGRLAELAVEHPPAIGNFELLSGKLHHVRPELVVSVRHTGWTDDARLRAPVFRGLRADIAPSACMAAPSDEQLSADPAPSNEPTVRVSITNADKVFWPDEGYTKGDLCSYYAAVAPAMLPFLHDRPIVLVRYPDGIHGKSFYQWHPPRGTPKWLRTLEVYDDAGQRRHAFLVDDADALVHIANLGAIPIHVLPWRAGTPESCDFLTIDFDVGEQPLKHAVKLALDLHELLAELGLPGYAKTSGQKGLHVLVPLGRGIGFDTAKLLAELLGRILATRNSDIATVERRVNKRGPRVYVDTGQTGESRTIVAPYSVRAYPGATVSTPLTWDEVHLALEPQRHQLQSVPLRLAETGDPMRSMLDEAPDVGTAIARIERWVR
jgi:bifunctional non-homologous end joining protein LigD